MNKTLVANELNKIAKAIYALDKNTAADMAVIAKKLEEGIAKFEKAHTAEIDAINALKAEEEKLAAKRKEIEGTMGNAFKVFDKEYGLSKASKAIANAVAEEMSVKGNVETLLQDLTAAQRDLINYKESENFSYKGMFETLVSMLNGTEYDAYIKLLIEGGKKNLVEVKRVTGQLVTASKSFKAEYVKKYNERAAEWEARNPDKPLPPLKASRNIRTAGILDVFSLLGGWFKKVFGGLKASIVNLCKYFVGRKAEIDSIQAYIAKVSAAAKQAK